MKKNVASVFLFFLIPLVSLAAQSGLQKGLGVIIFADGDEISIYRANALKSYAVSTGNVMGMQLEPGDLIQTGPGTMVEIQLLPSQSVLKVAENTSFRLTGINSPTGNTIDVIYGRIHAKVDPLFGKSGFFIRGKTAVAAVRGTEFGYDVVAVPGIGQEPSSQIYTFDGTVSVYALQPGDPMAQSSIPFDGSNLSKLKSYDVITGQQVVVYDTPDETSKSTLNKSTSKDSISTEGKRSVVSSPAMKNSIRNFWKNHPDQGYVFSKEDLQAKFYGIQIAKIADPTPSPTTTATAPSNPGVAPSPSPTPTPPAIALVTTKNSLADTIEPYPILKSVDIISPNQYAMTEEPLKLIGIILGSVGMVVNIAGTTLYNFGTDLGLSTTNSQNTGIISISLGGAMLVSGLVCYVIGLFQ